MERCVFIGPSLNSVKDDFPRLCTFSPRAQGEPRYTWQNTWHVVVSYHHGSTTLVNWGHPWLDIMVRPFVRQEMQIDEFNPVPWIPCVTTEKVIVRFKIFLHSGENVPASETVHLSASHPLLKNKDAEIHRECECYQNMLHYELLNSSCTAIATAYT